jgi:RimJ/RimL family protein N-acetyltransferase
MTIFQNPPTLENQRVLLKPLAEEDFNGLCEAGADLALWKYSLTPIHSKEDILYYLHAALVERNQERSLPFTIFDKAVGKIAGSTRFGNFSWENKRVEIGWTWIGQEFQKTGLNRACKFELFSYAFETLELCRVELKADALNLNSQEAMRKIGATEEGTFRKHLKTGTGRMRDSVYFSILDTEWPEIKQTRFKEFV